MPLRGKLVVLVDDEPGLRRALKRLLVGRGATVETACNGREALDKVLALRPDVVLMDVNMPEMNGLKAAREISRRCPTRVVLMSSDDRQGVAAAILGCPFIGKSAPLEDLLTFMALATGDLLYRHV